MESNSELRRRGPLEPEQGSDPWLLKARIGPEAGSILTWEQAVRVCRKRRWLLLGITAGLTLMAVAVSLWIRDSYRPVARVEIDPLGSGISPLPEIESVRGAGDQEYLDTQVQILQSDGLAVRTIRALHLDEDPEFSGVEKNAGSEASAGGEPSDSSKNEIPFVKEQLDLATTTPAEAAALQSFQGKLLVNPLRGSRLVEVSFTSHDPKRARAVANTLVTQFIEQNYRNRYITTMEASQWLSSQLNDLRERVAESNRAVTEYQKRFGLVDSDEKDVPLGQLMGEVSRQLSDAQADRIQAEAAARMLDEGRAEAIPSLRDDLFYQNLQTRYAEVRSQLAETQTVYGEESSNYKKLKGEADELAKQLEGERANVIKRVRSTLETAKAREQMMLQVREKLLAQMGEASSHLVEYRMLRNQAIANAALYNTLEARLQEAGIYAGLRSGNIRVVDMAPLLQKPTGPHRVVIVGLGVMAGLGLAVLVAFVLESFDNTVRIPDDIKSWTSLPYLAVVPKIRASRFVEFLADKLLISDVSEQRNGASSYPKLFWDKLRTAEAESMRTLRFALTSQRQSAPQVILVSSPSAGEGKTTVALNLAGVLAQQGRTCLIEGDLRHPMIESALGLEPRWGLEEVLAGRKLLSEVLIETKGFPGFVVLPVKDMPSSPADVLASESMKATVNALRQQFEHVVIDSPPMLSFADARTLASFSDAVVLVTRYGCTTRRAITRSAELLAESPSLVLGVVLNDMDLGSADYHYFNYGYSRAMTGNGNYQSYGKSLPPAADAQKAEKSKGAHA